MILFLVSSLHLHVSLWDARTTYFQASDWSMELYKRILLEETETRTPLISVSCIESDILHRTCLFMNNSAWLCCLLSWFHQFHNLEIVFMNANMHVSKIKFWYLKHTIYYLKVDFFINTILRSAVSSFNHLFIWLLRGLVTCQLIGQSPLIIGWNWHWRCGTEIYYLQGKIVWDNIPIEQVN